MTFSLVFFNVLKVEDKVYLRLSVVCFFFISKVYSFKRQNATKYTGGIQGS